MKIVLLLLSLQLTLMIPLANIPDILSLYRTSDSISKNISDLVQHYYPFAKKVNAKKNSAILPPRYKNRNALTNLPIGFVQCHHHLQHTCQRVDHLRNLS